VTVELTRSVARYGPLEVERLQERLAQGAEADPRVPVQELWATQPADGPAAWTYIANPLLALQAVVWAIIPPSRYLGPRMVY
jgi:hypothetical protein